MPVIATQSRATGARVKWAVARRWIGGSEAGNQEHRIGRRPHRIRRSTGSRKSIGGTVVTAHTGVVGAPAPGDASEERP
jgi:hypothetical protein